MKKTLLISAAVAMGVAGLAVAPASAAARMFSAASPTRNGVSAGSRLARP